MEMVGEKKRGGLQLRLGAPVQKITFSSHSHARMLSSESTICSSSTLSNGRKGRKKEGKGINEMK